MRANTVCISRTDCHACYCYATGLFLSICKEKRSKIGTLMQCRRQLNKTKGKKFGKKSEDNSP